MSAASFLLLDHERCCSSMGSVLEVLLLRLRLKDFGVQGLRLGFDGEGLGLGFWVQGLGFRFPGKVYEVLFLLWLRV